MNGRELKFRNLIGGILTVALALPCVASASPPSNMAVGEIDAVVKFCSRIDPRLEDDMERFRALILREVEPRARSSAEYRQGHDLVRDALAQIERKQARAACGTLTAKSEHAR